MLFRSNDTATTEIYTRRHTISLHDALPIPVTIAVAVGCSSGNDADSGTAKTETTVVEDVVVDADDFKPLADMTAVRGFFVDNVAGDLEGTLAVANDPEGGVYPVGTVIQLIPQEAMVKRAPGFDPGSNDWEFFTLDVTAAGRA